MHRQSQEASVGSPNILAHKARVWGIRCLVAIGLLAVILGIHFRGLWAAGVGEAMWGISVSADPVGVMSEAFESTVQRQNGCGDVVTLYSFPFGEF